MTNINKNFEIEAIAAAFSADEPAIEITSLTQLQLENSSIEKQSQWKKLYDEVLGQPSTANTVLFRVVTEADLRKFRKTRSEIARIARVERASKTHMVYPVTVQKSARLGRIVQPRKCVSGRRNVRCNFNLGFEQVASQKLIQEPDVGKVFIVKNSFFSEEFVVTVNMVGQLVSDVVNRRYTPRLLINDITNKPDVK